MKDEVKNTSNTHMIMDLFFPYEFKSQVNYASCSVLIPGDSRPPIPVILGHPC